MTQLTWKIRIFLVIDSERIESLKRSEFDISSSDQGLDFLCHPVLSVWCVFPLWLFLQVLMFKNAPLRAGKTVLQLGKSIFRQGFDGLWGRFCLPPEGGVGREEEQREMIWLSEVGEGCRSVGMLEVWINMIKCAISPGFTLDVLMEFGKNSLEACFVKVPRDDIHAIRMSLLLFWYHELKLAECAVLTLASGGM